MPEFDPTYGYRKQQLLQIEAPPAPENFAEFWRTRYEQAMKLETQSVLSPSDEIHRDFEIFDLKFVSTENISIGGWVLVPKNAPVKRGLVVGHGYGGCSGPDFDLPIADAVFLFPCFRGLARSQHPQISNDPQYHVLHDIDKRDHYILGGCVEDLWLAVSALLELFPAVAGHVGYLGFSFGGGIGALALPWDVRIQRAHLHVPSFGHHLLRLQWPTSGSAAAVQNYQREHGNALETLSYYDAAIAARYIKIPVHVAAALSDPVVAPPGQYCIYNALAGEKELFELDCGHSNCPRQAAQQKQLLTELHEFFIAL